MPRPRSEVPTYRLHKPSGQAVVTIRNADGTRRDVYLGVYGSEESKQMYARVLAEDVPPAPRPAAAKVAPAAPLSLNELMDRFLDHAEVYYRRTDGTPTSEIEEYKLVVRTVRQLYGNTPAVQFGPKRLQAVRQHMINAKLSRGVINQRIGRVVRMFKWAVSEELIAETVYSALKTVRGLAAGRSEARESERVTPVDWAVVKATLPHLSRCLKSMVLFQWHTGARPGEVCKIRLRDIDRTGRVWLYTVPMHKTIRTGKERIIAIGPRGQAVLRPFIREEDPDRFLFSPEETVASLRAAQRASRKTRVQPSQLNRRKAAPKRKPGKKYPPRSYYHAVQKAVLAANRAMACEACKKREPKDRCPACKAATLPDWHPHQLRHSFATRANEVFGVEEVQTALGHSTLSATQIYAEKSVAKAVQIAAAIG